MAFALSDDLRGSLGLVPCYYFYNSGSGEDRSPQNDFSEYLLDTLYQLSDIILCGALLEARAAPEFDEDDVRLIFSEHDLGRYGFTFHTKQVPKVDAVLRQLARLSPVEAKQAIDTFATRRYAFGALWQLLDVALMNFQNTDAVRRGVRNLYYDQREWRILRSHATNCTLFCIDPDEERRISKNDEAAQVSERILSELSALGIDFGENDRSKLRHTFALYGVEISGRLHRFSELIDHVMVPEAWSAEISGRLDRSRIRVRTYR